MMTFSHKFPTSDRRFRGVGESGDPILSQINNIPSGNPTPPIPNPGAWYKAGFETFSDNDLVDTFQDWSGNANHLTAAGSARPTFKTAILNGKPIIRFDGVANVLQKIGISGLNGSNFTFFVVGCINGVTAFGQFISVRNTAGTSFAEIRLNAVATQYSAIGSVGSGVANFGPVLIGTYRIIGSRYPVAGNIEIYSKDVIADSQAETGTFAANNICLGARQGPALFLNGDIAEVFCYNSLLDSGSITIVANYLASEYAL